MLLKIRHVTNIEGAKRARDDRQTIGEADIGFVVSDVSFISMTLALPPALAMSRPVRTPFCW